MVIESVYHEAIVVISVYGSFLYDSNIHLTKNIFILTQFLLCVCNDISMKFTYQTVNDCPGFRVSRNREHLLLVLYYTLIHLMVLQNVNLLISRKYNTR